MKLRPLARQLNSIRSFLTTYWFISVLLCIGAFAGLSGCSHKTALAAQVTLSSPQGFKEPLFAVRPPQGQEAEQFQQALKAFELDRRPLDERMALWETFVKEHPDNPWTPTIQLNLGLDYHLGFRFTRALPALKTTWEATKDSKDPKVKAIADRAVGEYCVTLAHLGRMEELEPLLQEVKGRSVTGPATELLAGAVDGLRSMKVRPEVSFLCGPNGLRHLALKLGKMTPATRKLLDCAVSTQKGTSLQAMEKLALKAELKLQAAYREPGATFLTPCLVHWKAGHFAAVLDPVEGKYPVVDDTAGFNRTNAKITSAALDEECSGYFLVPQGPLPPGWRKVDSEEASKVWGRGEPGFHKNNLDTQVTSVKVCTEKDCKCMTTWDVHAMLVSLSLADIPVGLSPAAFATPFRLSYGQREIGLPSVADFSNLGPKWSHNFMSYVYPNAVGARVFFPGGGGEDFSFGPYLTTPLSFPGDGETILERKGTVDSLGYPESYEMRWPDGSKRIYAKRIGDRFHLTEMVDAQGNSTRIEFDALGRVSGVRDAMNRLMRFDYELTSDPLKITKVTDPFGRFATLAYSDAGKLIAVTDIIGITSSYHYGINDFIDQLTTPYGTTHFSYGDHRDDPTMNPLDPMRWLEVVDSAGRKYRVEHPIDSNDPTPFGHLPDSDPDPTPVGMPIRNEYLNTNSTFYWSPQQLEGGLDYTKATQYKFHNFLGLGTSQILESVRQPLQRRKWFSLKNQEVGIYPYVADLYVPWVPQASLVGKVGQVLGDGTTQLTQYEYNAKGNVSRRIDPSGRVYDYAYAPNDIDVTSVSVNGNVLMSATYDGNHNILSVTNSSGSTSTFTYNSNGQVLTSTNVLGETTSYQYSATGNLERIEEPLGKVTTFQFDSAERVSSATDSEGHTVSVEYDAADRPVRLQYPDGTSENIVYDRLDVAETTDRLGRKTSMVYDPLQRLTAITDPNGGVVSMDYGIFDEPTRLTDQGGKQTQFIYDIQQRLTRKQFADGTGQDLTYQPCCGRPSTITDPLGNVKTFHYNIDNTVRKVDYSGTTPDVEFSYDTILPRPLSMTDGTGTTNYTYGAFGAPGANQLASVTGPLGDQASFVHDIAGRMTSRTVNGQIETQSFDPLWRTTSTTNALDTFNLNYLGLTGQVTGVNSTQGPTMQYTYGNNLADRRLAQIKNLGRVTGNVLSQFDYTTNAEAQITQMIETHGIAASPTPTNTITPTNTTTPTPTPCPPDCCCKKKCCKKCDKDKCKKKKCCTKCKCDKKCNKGRGHGHHGNGHGRGPDHHDDDGILTGFARGFRNGTVALVLSFFSLMAAYILSQPSRRKHWKLRLTCLGLSTSLALQGCLVGNVDVGANTSVAYQFQYDLLGQLVGVDLNNTPAARFQFDASGNLDSLTLGNTTTAFTHNNLNQRTSPGNNTYDAKGQTTDQNGRVFEWDERGQVTAIVMGTHRSEMGYDGAGRRVRIVEKENNVVQSDKRYWWLGGTIVCERDALQVGNPITKRYFGQGLVDAGTKLYYTTDHLGSVRQLVDDTGAVRADYRYSTYGERTKISGDLDSEWGYAGLWHHAPSGLDLATFRLYDSEMGRWISRDPLGEGHDRTLYSYCGNDPINGVDPSGLIEDATLANEAMFGRYGTPGGLEHLNLPCPSASDAALFVLGELFPVADFAITANDIMGDGIVTPGELLWSLPQLAPGISHGMMNAAGETLESVGRSLRGNKIPSSKVSAPQPAPHRPPVGDDGFPVELHHRNQDPTGPLDEMTRTDHRLGPNYSKNHANTGQAPSKIDRNAFNKQREAYWRAQHRNGR